MQVAEEEEQILLSKFFGEVDIREWCVGFRCEVFFELIPIHVIAGLISTLFSACFHIPRSQEPSFSAVFRPALNCHLS